MKKGRKALFFVSKLKGVKKMNNCKCIDLERGSERELVKGCFNYLYLKRNREDNYYIIAIADGVAEMKINYCPFCGRKLENDKY